MPASESYHLDQSYTYFEDFFLYEDFNNYLNYEIDINISSDEANPNTTKSLKDSLSKLLKSYHLKNLKEVKNIIREEFSTLLDKNKELEIAINFSPKNNRFNHYQEELSSNNLILLSDKDNLLSSYNYEHLNYSERVLNAKIPSTGHLYQYLGGSLTYYFDDSVSDKEMAISLKARKYYRVNIPKEITGKDKRFVYHNDFKTPIYTVDSYFRLTQQNLEKERVTIYPGVLKDEDSNQDTKIKRIIASIGKSFDVKNSQLLTMDKTNRGEYHIQRIDLDLKTKTSTLYRDDKTISVKFESLIEEFKLALLIKGEPI